MTNQYADSDSIVNHYVEPESESGPVSAPNMLLVAREESPEPITVFVRARIEEWLSSGKKLKDLVERGGFGGESGKSSMPSQVKAGTSSVTNISGPKFAKAFGFTSYPALVSAAYAAARGETSAAEENALSEAVRLALEYGVTQVQIDRAVASVAKDRQSLLEPLEWLSLFHAQKSLDAKIDGDLRAAEHVDLTRKKATARYHDEVEEKREKRAQSAPPRRRSKAG